VNYFLHSGHLEIEGLKMSKSLKNFITIRWGHFVGCMSACESKQLGGEVARCARKPKLLLVLMLN
jgi:hypothetical protein